MKQEIVVKRQSGEIETVSFEKAVITKHVFEQIKKLTAEAGRGEVLEARVYKIKNNLAQLEKEYNDFMNEGGEGFVPDFTESKKFRTWEEIEVIK